MKKLYNIGILALTGLMALSCVSDEMVVFDADKVTAPGMGSIPETVLVSDGEDLRFEFTGVDYGMASAKTYVLQASDSEDFATIEKVAASFGEGVATIRQSALNTAVLNLGADPDNAFTVYMRIVANMVTDKNIAIASTTSYSNVISAVVTPYNQLMLDKDVYDVVYVIGNYCGWSHDATQYLYNYSKDGKTYSGVVDFGDKCVDGFKLTGAASWDDSTGNWGSEAQEETSEQTVIQLINGGGSKDIKCWNKRFYSMSYDKSALVLSMNWGADQISIIGLNGDWNTDIPMEYNADFVRFYADVTADSDTEYKFRADADWTLNWGDGLSVGGANIALPAGSYRIYLDFNKKTVEANAKMFGKDEPTAAGSGEGGDDPVEEPFTGWSLIGEINGASWDADVDMTEADGVWTAVADVQGGFKLRKDHDWAENRGGAFVAFGEPFAVENNGDNIDAGQGLRKVVYNSADETVTVTDATGIWSVIGEVEGSTWDKDFWMEETEAGVWTSPALDIKGSFMVRQNGGWDSNMGAAADAEVTIESGVAVAAAAGGQNLKVPAEGKYIVVYDSNAGTITVTAALPSEKWSLVGAFNGWDAAAGIYLTEYRSGVWVSPAVELSGEFKLVFDNSWDVNRGDAMTSLGELFAVTQNGGNISVEEGRYQIAYIPALEKVVVNKVEESWSVIGGQEGFSWDNDTPLYKLGDVLQSVPFFAEADAEIKIRYAGGWDVNRGGTFASIDQPFAVEQNGSNIKVPASGYYYVIYDPASDAAALCGTWGVIGDFNGWAADVPMVKDGDCWYSPEFISTAAGFKIRYAGGWDVNLGGSFVSLGTPFEAVAGGDNISPEPGTYKLVYDAANGTLTLNSK